MDPLNKFSFCGKSIKYLNDMVKEKKIITMNIVFIKPISFSLTKKNPFVMSKQF